MFLFHCIVVCVCVQRVCKLRGWAKDTPKNKETYDVMMEIWTGLRSKADKDNDGQVRLSSCGCPSVHLRSSSSIRMSVCACVCVKVCAAIKKGNCMSSGSFWGLQRAN